MPDLSIKEREALIHLIEECAEVQKAATKALRFGWYPLAKGVQYNNHRDLREEMRDVNSAFDCVINGS